MIKRNYLGYEVNYAQVRAGQYFLYDDKLYLKMADMGKVPEADGIALNIEGGFFCSFNSCTPVYPIDCTLEIRNRRETLYMTERGLEKQGNFFFMISSMGRKYMVIHSDEYLLVDLAYGDCEKINFEDERQFCIVGVDFILNRISTEE